MAKRKREVIELPDLPEEKTLSYDHEIYQRMIDLLHKARPDLCVCYVCDGAEMLFIAGVTDWLDGFLARRWQAESAFGRIMDPFCDKVLVLGACRPPYANSRQRRRLKTMTG